MQMLEHLVGVDKEHIEALTQRLMAQRLGQMTLPYPSRAADEYILFLTNVVTTRQLEYLRPDLLILDDFGLKPLTAPAPSDLYDVINERYERGSIMLTSNRAPAEWPDLFGNPLLASAGLDRLTHHAEMIVITGQSFRAQGRVRLEQEVLSA